MLSRRRLLASAAGSAAAVGLTQSLPANAQINGLDLGQFGVSDLDDIIGQLIPPDQLDDGEPQTDVTSAAIERPLNPAPQDHPWDAVKHYVGSNDTYLAPRVAEYVPAEPPMPHMVTIEELTESGAVFEADLERSNLNRQLEIKDEVDGLVRHVRSFPDGYIINIPPGEYRIDRLNIRPFRSRGTNIGARFIFRGMIGPNGEHPVISTSNSGLSLGVKADLESENPFLALEVENVEIKSSQRGKDGGPGAAIRYVHFRNVLFSGGFKNPHFYSDWPTVSIYNNCAFTRGGKGDGLTHCFYGGYTQAVIMRNCLFSSTRGQGHALKTYARHIDIRGCTFANWWHDEEPELGFFGDQAPVDFGAHAQTTFALNHIIKRGGNPRRYRAVSAIEYRNRVFENNRNAQLPNFKTNGRDYDYTQVDNEVGTANETDPSSEELYRHLFVGNKVFNGVLPDGGVDPQVEDAPGALLRNSGTMYNWSHGGGSLRRTGDPNHLVTPPDYGLRNERSVVYVAQNELQGVPFNELYRGPYGHAEDPGPVVDLSTEYPEWVLSRLKPQTTEDHWWDESWPEGPYPHP